jgi:hypothetical protein
MVVVSGTSKENNKLNVAPSGSIQLVLQMCILLLDCRAFFRCDDGHDDIDE